MSLEHNFLRRLERNILEQYQQSHWSDSDVEDVKKAMKQKMDVCIELFDRNDVTESECVRMMCRFMDRRFYDESKSDTEGD